MREIKFRAWDKKGNFMTDDLVIEGDGVWLFCGDRAYLCHHMDINKEIK